MMQGSGWQKVDQHKPEEKLERASHLSLLPNEVDSQSPLTETSELPRNSEKSLWTLLALAFTAGFTVALGLVLFNRNFEFNREVKATSAYSPVFATTKIQYHNIQLNGTLFPPKEQSWSRLEPGRAEDQWEKFEAFYLFPLSRQDVLGLGKDPKSVARFDDERFHLGDEAYIGTLDINHQIHCLNELRKMAFADYHGWGQKASKKQHNDMWWIHLRHCTDNLLQNILCHADADVITYRWVDKAVYEQPDFSINKKCRDIEALFKWRDQQREHLNKFIGPRRPNGVKPVPAEKANYEMFGYEGSELFDKDGNPLDS